MLWLTLKIERRGIEDYKADNGASETVVDITTVKTHALAFLTIENTDANCGDVSRVSSRSTDQGHTHQQPFP